MAWTVVINTTTYPPQVYDWGGGNKLTAVRVTCTSDASSSGNQTMSTLIDTAFSGNQLAGHSVMQRIRGSLFYAFKYVHTGTVTAPTVTITDGAGATILSQTLATSGTAIISGDISLGQFPPIRDLIFASTTLGAAGVSEYEFWFIK